MNLFAILDQIGDLKKEKKRRRRKIVGKNSGKNWKNYSSSAQKMGIENRTTNARYGFTKKPEKGVQNWSSPLRSPRTIFNIKNGEHFQDLEFSAWISSRILERRREIESIEGRRFIRGAWMEGHTRHAVPALRNFWVASSFFRFNHDRRHSILFRMVNCKPSCICSQGLSRKKKNIDASRQRDAQ